MRIKLDENLSRHLKTYLEQIGHSASTASEERLLGKRDVELGAAAHAQGLMVFTLDLDFADMRKFAPGSHPGVIVFRPRSMGPLAVNRFILDFARGEDLEHFRGCLVVVEPGRVRVRRPPLDTDSSGWEDFPLS